LFDHRNQNEESRKKLSTARLTLIMALAVAASMVLASVAFAQGTTAQRYFEADLNPLNRSGAEGTAILKKEGTKLTTRIYSTDMAPKLPHAQHIHGFKQAVSECPTLAASGRDNLITTAEGLPSYGPIQVSLTTRGDTSPDSALAVERFPVANSGGFLKYERTFSVPRSVASNLGKKAIVQHGVDLNHNGRYDFRSAGRSELDPSLPQEATIPANCGVINPVG
jgi:hypothetical protein